LCHSLVHSELYAANRHPEFISGSLGVSRKCFARRCWNEFSM